MKKIIITVQHTESEHHVTGYVGAQGNWNLTERGRAQARAIGEWLAQREGGCEGSRLYVSDLNRAMQTAEGINESLKIPQERFVVTEALREISLGEGNGKPRDWYNEHVTPQPAVYDPDFRSFPDAESDTELWNRVAKVYEEVLASDDERILIVSHGGALTFLNAMLMGDTFADTLKRKFYGHSGGVTKFVIEPDRPTVVPYMNLYIG